MLDEHGIIADPQGVLKVDDKPKLVPGHCDPTCNVHDWYVGVRDGLSRQCGRFPLVAKPTDAVRARAHHFPEVKDENTDAPVSRRLCPTIPTQTEF